MLVPALALILASVVPCSPPGRPIVAEVYYDAIGDDTGLEFVELFNPGSDPWPLAGLRLESGDGSGPGRWSVRWTAAAGDTIPGAGRFVIGGARVFPPPQALVSLDLQNGPDAVRLVWSDATSEVVGYGAHEFSEYSCGAPAPDAPSGFSLARVPDASDQGSNAVDFRVATPSPGRANQPERDAALLTGRLALDPEQPGAGESARLTVALTNRGARSIEPGEVSAVVSAAGLALAEAALDHTLVAGDSATLVVALPPLPPAKHVVRVALRLAGDGDAANDVDSLRARWGAGPLVVSEIQFHPAAGEGEWVEVRNRSGAPFAVADARLSDRLDRPAAPALGIDPLAPDSLAVLAQDRAALLARFPRLDPARIWQVSPWPSLNNGDDSSGVADVVILREADGTACDRVPYSAAGVPAGTTLERRADGGLVPGESGGTPLAFPAPPAPLAGRLEVRPRRLAAGASARVEWELPWETGRVAIDLYDLSGRRVASVLPEVVARGRGGATWNAVVPGGLYLLVLSASDVRRGERIVATAPVRFEGPP